MIDFMLRLGGLWVGVSVFFQANEMFALKNVWSDEGVWRWETLRKDYQSIPAVQSGLSILLNQKSFNFILVLQYLASTVLCALSTQDSDFNYRGLQVVALFICFFSTWLTAIRWRGIFYGGADSMTLIVLFSLLMAQLSRLLGWSEWVAKACLAYIAVHLTASYFIAGVVKLKNPKWRNGTAIREFVEKPRYDSPPLWFFKLSRSPKFALIASWLVILLELIFPLAWLHPVACVTLITLAFNFHILNYFIFGLNRFVWAWLAAYPALIYWSSNLS